MVHLCVISDLDIIPEHRVAEYRTMSDHTSITNHAIAKSRMLTDNDVVAQNNETIKRRTRCKR